MKNWGKAGARRRKGWRPSVRGIAMNPRDHPHGGGRKNKGGKAARSPWGWLTKGPKTVKRKRWFIVTPRWKVFIENNRRQNVHKLNHFINISISISNTS